MHSSKCQVTLDQQGADCHMELFLLECFPHSASESARTPFNVHLASSQLRQPTLAQSRLVCYLMYFPKLTPPIIGLMMIYSPYRQLTNRFGRGQSQNDVETAFCQCDFSTSIKGWSPFMKLHYIEYRSCVLLTVSCVIISSPRSHPPPLS